MAKAEVLCYKTIANADAQSPESPGNVHATFKESRNQRRFGEIYSSSIWRKVITDVYLEKY